MTKKHGHEDKHAHCEHCLHACDHCDVAYCCDCNREWGTCKQTLFWPYTPYWETTTTFPPNTSTTVLAHAHGHEN